MNKKWLAAPLLALACTCLGASAKEWKELRFGVNPSYPPFESSTADGGVQGFGVDLGNAICAELKLKCVWISNDFDGLIPALKAGKFDAIESSMTVTTRGASRSTSATGSMPAPRPSSRARARGWNPPASR